jgi:hypothetical protein
MRSPWSPAAVLLVLAMAIGSVLMWLGLPAGLIYLASQIADSSTPSMGPYLLVLIGLPVGMALIAKGLGWLDRRHARLTRAEAEGPHRAPWLRSMRGERAEQRRGGVLDRVMIISVGIAIVVAAIWFFAFAGSSLPGS